MKLSNLIALSLIFLSINVLACDELLAEKYIKEGSYYFVACSQDGMSKVGKYINNIHYQGLVDNKTGKVIIPIKYNNLGYFSEGLANASFQGKTGFIDIHDKVVIPFQYDGASPFRNGVANVVLERNGSETKNALIDRTGKIVTPTTYDFIIYDSNADVYTVTKNHKHGLLNNQGKLLVPLIYDYIYSFFEGKAVVENKGKFSVVDSTGKIIVPFIYDHIYPYSDGLAVVKKNSKYGFIDGNGKLVIDFKYDDIYSFHQGYQKELSSTKKEEKLEVKYPGRKGKT